MSYAQIAVLSVWLTIVLWDAISLAFFWDCLRVNIRARAENRVAKASGNGRVIVARYRYRISNWYVLVSFLALSAGISATYSNIFAYHPPPDIRLINSITRFLLITMIFGMWRTKRGNIALYREVDAKHRREVRIAKAQPPH